MSVWHLLELYWIQGECWALVEECSLLCPILVNIFSPPQLSLWFVYICASVLFLQILLCHKNLGQK